MNFECENITGGMRCGNRSFWVNSSSKELICIKCRNKIALMSFFAELSEVNKEAQPEKYPSHAPKTDREPAVKTGAPLPDFANKQSKEDEGSEPIEVTEPVKTQRQKLFGKTSKKPQDVDT